MEICGCTRSRGVSWTPRCSFVRCETGRERTAVAGAEGGGGPVEWGGVSASDDLGTGWISLRGFAVSTCGYRIVQSSTRSTRSPSCPPSYRTPPASPPPSSTPPSPSWPKGPRTPRAPMGPQFSGPLSYLTWLRPSTSCPPSPNPFPSPFPPSSSRETSIPPTSSGWPTLTPCPLSSSSTSPTASSCI